MSIEQQVKDIVAEQLGVSIDEVKNESSFQDDLGADSFRLIYLIFTQPENQLPNHSIILIKEKHHESKTCSHHRLRANFPRR